MGLSWSGLVNNLTNSAKEKRIPIDGTFELTSRCNLQCKMCYICREANDREAIKREKTAEEWIELARQCRDQGMLYLLLTGGEVFIREDFRQIYEALSNMGFNICVYTNATMITPKVVEWLKLAPPSKIEVTLYGSSAETYERICGSKVAFDHAINGIKLLQAVGINLELRTTVIKDNMSDFNNIVDLAMNLGLDIGLVSYISPRRESVDCKKSEYSRMTPWELVEFGRNANNYYKQAFSKHFGSAKFDERFTVKKESSSHDEDRYCGNIKDAFSCSAGQSSFSITWEGHMTPCGIMGEPITFPFKDGFERSWKELCKLCNQIPQCIECSTCTLRQYCISCPARLKNETGQYSLPAPYLCNTAEELKKTLA